MNLAISSLVIFILVPPAILARRVYFTRELSKKFTDKNTIQEIFSSIFLAGLLHFIWINVVECVDKEVDFEIIFKILFNPSSLNDYYSITSNVRSIFWYFISLSLVAMSISWLFRNTVRYFALDRSINFLRYDNNWYYLFTGEVLDIKKYNSDKEVNSKPVNQRVVDVLAKSNNKEVFYRGNLIDFQLDKNNTVEYIVLSYPTKKAKGEDRKQIPSDYFIIPYEEILNINLMYFSSTKD